MADKIDLSEISLDQWLDLFIPKDPKRPDIDQRRRTVLPWYSDSDCWEYSGHPAMRWMRNDIMWCLKLAAMIVAIRHGIKPLRVIDGSTVTGRVPVEYGHVYKGGNWHDYWARQDVEYYETQEANGEFFQICHLMFPAGVIMLDNWHADQVEEFIGGHDLPWISRDDKLHRDHADITHGGRINGDVKLCKKEGAL